jgi:3-oxoacyl-[acyl-carrier-protein] synthase II
MSFAENREVCISAVGAITPLGDTLEQIGQHLYNSKSGIKAIEKFDASSFLTQWAGLPEEGNQRRWPRADGAPLARPGEFCYADRAIANLLREVDVEDIYEAARIGCVLGVDEPAMDIQRCITFLRGAPHKTEKRQDRIREAASFFRISEFLDTETSTVLRSVHRRVRFSGYTRCHVGLCSASLQAIGMGVRAIRNGIVDAVITGGVSSKVTPANLARLDGIGAVCTDPKLEGAARSRPFDSRRSGFVPAEGAVLFLLERENEVRRRNGKAYCRVIGYGSSMGAQHIIAPHLNDLEMLLCMKRAINDAKVTVREIDCINAHGTSTKLNDEHEARALSALFADSRDVTVTATKSLHGHLIAAAGAMEVLTSIISMQHSFVPAILNLLEPEPEMALELAAQRIDRPVRRVLKNSFGMGGLAASLVLENATAVS